MTDTFAVQGELSPAQSFAAASGESATPADAAQPELPLAPNGFLKFGLAPELIRAVEDLGFTQPTPVQEQTIPLALPSDDSTAGFIDLMVSSQTGSGKTVAFLLPVLHTLLNQQVQAQAKERADYEHAAAEAAARGEPAPKRPKRKDPTSSRNFKAATPGALILCPTRELAQQVAHDAIDLVRHCRGLRVANVIGGMPYQLQIAKLQNADLVIATPGRLLDLQRSAQIKLDKVQFLVVDEADRMLDLGFADDLAEVNKLTIERKQTMMFSATFAPRIQQLASRVMRQPRKIQIDNPQEKHVNIKQMLFWADSAQHKRKLLDHWLRDTTINQAIVFASTQIECDGLANDLQQAGFDAVALHGALSQGLRNRRLMALRQGHVQVLVATDVAARGLDVPTITHVFNFGLPMKAEDYTHRIGRTGRAGRDGLAVTFAEVRDRRKIFDIEGYTRQPFKAETVPGLEPQQRAPQGRPGGDFAGRGRDGQSRGNKFGAGRSGSGFGGGFADKPVRGRPFVGAHQNAGGFAPQGGDDRGDSRNGAREGFSYERKGGFNDRFAGGRSEGFAARGDFVERRPAFGKPATARPGNGGKVFVPRDLKKRAYKPAD
jgi:superfamily II DNA/RNA helicase